MKALIMAVMSAVNTESVTDPVEVKFDGLTGATRVAELRVDSEGNRELVVDLLAARRQNVSPRQLADEVHRLTEK